MTCVQSGEFSSIPAIPGNRNHAVIAPVSQWTSTVPQLLIREQLHPSLFDIKHGLHFVKETPKVLDR